jgi:hypothetical protein
MIQAVLLLSKNNNKRYNDDRDAAMRTLIRDTMMYYIQLQDMITINGIMHAIGRHA